MVVKVLALIAVLSTVAAAVPAKNFTNATKRSYVCPPDFVRLSHRCYYFSDNATNWHDAYFQCRELHSNLAVIRTPHQDKLIRKTLNKKTLAPLERWIGGLYDWGQMQWKWAASGKLLTYQGFPQMPSQGPEGLRWHCIVVDPRLGYQWNIRNCIDRRHFICHTKMKTLTNRSKKKLEQQYNTGKLNEIPVPEISNGVEDLKKIQVQQPRNDFARRSKRRYYRNKGRRSRKRSGESNKIDGVSSYDDRDRIRWTTYYKNYTLSPLHPKAIVEEFSFEKNA